jgi:hypothetical protein
MSRPYRERLRPIVGGLGTGLAGGGERRNPSGSGENAEPPCFAAPPHLYQDDKFPRLGRGQAPFTPAPQGRAGNAPATP